MSPKFRVFVIFSFHNQLQTTDSLVERLLLNQDCANFEPALTRCPPSAFPCQIPRPIPLKACPRIMRTRNSPLHGVPWRTACLPRMCRGTHCSCRRQCSHWNPIISKLPEIITIFSYSVAAPALGAAMARFLVLSLSGVYTQHPARFFPSGNRKLIF